MQIRDAVQSDFEAITAIYNDVVNHSTAIYNDRPASIADRVAWWSTSETSTLNVNRLCLE
jgi:L-amino acid N-acyltransferase